MFTLQNPTNPILACTNKNGLRLKTEHRGIILSGQPRGNLGILHNLVFGVLSSRASVATLTTRQQVKSNNKTHFTYVLSVVSH